MKDFYLPANVKIPARSKAFYNYITENVIYLLIKFSIAPYVFVKDGLKKREFQLIFYH